MSSDDPYPANPPEPDLVRETSPRYGEAPRGSTGRHESDHGSEDSASTFERLLARGRLRPAKRDLRSLGVPCDAPHEMSISQALKELRSEK